MTRDTRYQDISYYDILGVPAWATIPDIRQAYRELSKRYHPDTSVLDPDVAKLRFQRLNEAYQVLTNPTQRLLYDGRMNLGVIPTINVTPDLEPSDMLRRRPLSAQEIVALTAFGVVTAFSLLVVAFLSWQKS